MKTIKLPRLAVAPYAVVIWLSKKGRTPNKLRVWLGKMMRTDVNYKKEDWDLFFVFSMAATQMDPNNKKNSVLAMEVEPVTVTYPKFWKWADRRLDATLGTSTKRSIFKIRSGTSQIDQSFWENLTRVMGSDMGEMLQAQQIQQKLTSTPSAQAGHREFYSDWALAALMGYAQVYTETVTLRIWGNFKCPRNMLKTANNYRQE